MNTTSGLRPAGIARSMAAAALIAAATTFGAMPVAWGQNSIKILVNNQPITAYDIQQRTQMVRAFTGGKEGQKDAIEQLINEQLMLQEAAKYKVLPSDTDVDQELARRAAAARLKPAQFKQAMRQAGFDPSTFIEYLRANLGWATIVRGKFRASGGVSESDVNAALTEAEEEQDTRTATEYRVMPIIFVLPQGASNRAVSQRQQDASAFRSAFQGCDQALQQANGHPGVVVKPQVRRDEAQLSPGLRASLDATAVGGVTQPERVPEGIQMLAVCDKREITGQSEAQVETRSELQNERSRMLARRYLRDLRSDAVIDYR